MGAGGHLRTTCNNNETPTPHNLSIDPGKKITKYANTFVHNLHLLPIDTANKTNNHQYDLQTHITQQKQFAKATPT